VGVGVFTVLIANHGFHMGLRLEGQVADELACIVQKFDEPCPVRFGQGRKYNWVEILHTTT